MSLPLVNPFSTPYEAWSYRKVSLEEAQEIYKATGRQDFEPKDRLLATITTAREAAVYMANGRSDNGLLEYHIDKALASDPAFDAWRDAMPSRTPPELSRYQRLYPQFNATKVEAAIEAHGVVLSEGQILFHGGIWPGGPANAYATYRPFATTFSPQVALLNAVHMDKAFIANRIDLMVLRAHQPRTKVFSFRISGTDKGHEKEALFASGATLHLINCQLIGNHLVGNLNMATKEVPVYVLDVEIS